MKQLLSQLARVIRSKNSGPFELTFDIILDSPKVYAHLKQTEQISKEKMALLFGISEDKIISVIYFDPANAVKITMYRGLASGSPGDRDVYGAQQHAPLLDFECEV
jgi:hypothetical protein